MCLVIDANCFHLVFSGAPNGFAPVYAWIYEGKGCMIYGGTKYNGELQRGGMLPILLELRKLRKALPIPNAKVDAIAKKLKSKFPERKFDDEHIVALVIASGCRVVCSDDPGAIKYLKRTDVFADYSGVRRPKIFRGHDDHAKMCCDGNVIQACRECQA